MDLACLALVAVLFFALGAPSGYWVRELIVLSPGWLARWQAWFGWLKHSAKRRCASMEECRKAE